MVDDGDLHLRDHAAHTLADSFHKGMARKQAPDQKQTKKEKTETLEGVGAVISLEFEKLLTGEVDSKIAAEVINAKRAEATALNVEVDTLSEEIKVAEKPHMDKATNHKKVAKYHLNAGIDLLGITRATSVKKSDIKAAEQAIADVKTKKKNGDKKKVTK